MIYTLISWTKTFVVCFYSQTKLEYWTWDILNWDVNDTWCKHLYTFLWLLSVRSDSVMPSTGCILFHSFWRTKTTHQSKTHKLKSVFMFLFFLCLIKIHLSTEQSSSYTLETLWSLLQSFIFTLMELVSFWRAGQELIRLRMAHKVTLSSSGNWREQTVPCHSQLFRDIRKTFWNTSCLVVFSAQSSKTTSLAV